MSASMNTEAGRGKYRGERVRQMEEGVLRTEEPAARTESAARQTLTAPQTDERFTTATCYYCSEKGHIARYCPKKRKDRGDAARRPQGEDGRGGRGKDVPPPRNN